MPEDESSGLSADRREWEAMYPNQGYVLVRFDYNSPPGDALEKLATHESLDEIDGIPSDTNWRGTSSTLVRGTRTPTKTFELSLRRAHSSSSVV
ncbi:hypothetical protein [Halorhabdus rudnickae]|uniref:hypothetical protein n=1 Tax=Halorhabdus rudnickae TaxID=1775544 RepID=UPI0010834BC4|nr:hypothetical protein [Halorhabdus rudnickae]